MVCRQGGFPWRGVFGDEWDNSNVGSYSAAFGFANKAVGPYSFASGYGNTNLGVAFFSAGQSNSVATDYPSALGTLNNVSGLESAAIGVQNNVSGFVSHAIGAQNIVSGQQSIALGSQNNLSGFASCALGVSNLVTGSYGVALGLSNESAGQASTTSGTLTKASGDASTAMGFNTKAKSYASVVIGQFNDTTSTNSTAWITTDPVLVIGNGTSGTARSNAMTVLKNARTGINTTSPAAMLHVVRNAPSGGPFNLNAGAIFESDLSSFIQLSNPDNLQNGILSGNEATSIRSAIIFTADCSVLIRSGGNSTRIAVDNSGFVGIGTLSPIEKLDVIGNARATGNLILTTGEVNRTSTGAANVVPICYGSITSPSTINSSTGNFSISRISAGVYQITITSETYTNTGYTSTVTPVNSAAIIVTTNVAAGKLQVNTFNAAGTATDTDFHFSVFKQ